MSAPAVVEDLRSPTDVVNPKFNERNAGESPSETRMKIETEVFHLTEIDKTKYYSFALKTKTVGEYPNQRYYTTNPLQYLGRYIYSEEWERLGEWYAAAENFDDNGKKNRVVYDYEGNTCFVEVDPHDNSLLDSFQSSIQEYSNSLRQEDSLNSLNSGEPRSPDFFANPSRHTENKKHKMNKIH